MREIAGPAHEKRIGTQSPALAGRPRTDSTTFLTLLCYTPNARI